MIQVGQKAPDFALPGVERGRPDVYELFRPIGDGERVLLWFFPATFLPTATAELCAIRDAGWHDVDGLQVWGVSMDSIYAAAAYADDYDLPMVLLGDGRSAAEYYGVGYDEWEGHYGAPKRAVFLVDTDWNVAFSWATDDAFSPSAPSPVESVASVLADRFDEISPDVSVEYESFLG